ncbi:hypothetical protein HZY97_17620 [Sphingomonas sp. R-74633]|uniref:ExbD/TolR family protein n=1 Tax=Sphingomonas sp. R-74633 TaxID=2751188 RepID=UPI0015D17B2C|nr:hypothetical protein [Sphingomonas sp. R-74633]NYT42596.1 hypothetical protein [Sphingomonas sp. R-74633]
MLLALLLAQTNLALPAEVHLTIPPRGCRTLLDGKEVRFDQLRDRLKPLADAGTEIHFQPHPRADYACVDKVIGVLAKLPGAKLGFVGNEQSDRQEAK